MAFPARYVSRILEIQPERRLTMTLNLFLLVLGFVMLVLAAAKVPEPSRLSYGWLGMALWMLQVVLGGIK